MEAYLIEKLAKQSEEENRILAGEKIVQSDYSGEGDFIVTHTRLKQTRDGISVRTHTRYTAFPTHKHNYVEMMLVLSGNITHRLQGRVLTVGKGEILMLNRHITHSIDRAEREDVGVNVIMSDEFLNDLVPDLSGTVFSELIREHRLADGAPIYLHFSTGGEKRIENLIENLLFELTSDTPARHLMARTVALLLGYLSKDADSLLLGSSVEESKDAKRRRVITEYIKNNLKTATLNELCDIMFLTPPYLSKLTVQLFGEGFKDLLIRARLERAWKLFRDTNMPVGEVIRTVGYENESYFHRCFRSLYGKTPLTVRKTAKQHTLDK